MYIWTNFLNRRTLFERGKNVRCEIAGKTQNEKRSGREGPLHSSMDTCYHTVRREQNRLRPNKKLAPGSPVTTAPTRGRVNVPDSIVAGEQGEKTMKYLKMMGLAAVAAMALTAFAGAGSASATALCSANEEECASPFGSGTAIEASLKTGTKAVLKTDLATVECNKSTTTGKTTSGAGASVTGVVESLSFTECKTTGGTNCTATAVSLPYSGSITATGGGNGSLAVTKGSGGGNPGATVTCLGVIECTFRTSSAALSVTGGSPAVAKAAGIELAERAGLLCPSKEAKWTAEYSVSKPNPLWISEGP